MASPSPLRRDLLVSFGVIFAEAILILGVALLFVIPQAETPAEVTFFVLVLMGVDLVLFLAYGGWYLRRHFVRPVERLVEDVQRIARGDYQHRVSPSRALELAQIGESVNAMADRLILDKAMLADNVASLEATNRELVEARNQVIQAARLASVGTLAAGIAHEVGNPLGAIVGYVDVARGRLERAGQDTELLDAIREEAQRIDRIVRGLLDYSRPQPVAEEPGDPAEVVRQVRDLLESQGKLARVDDEWIVEGTPSRVVMDRHRLEQVLVNLVLNAVDALGDEGGRLVVKLFEQDGPGARFPARREGDPPDVNYLHRRRVSMDDQAERVATLRTAERLVCITVEDTGPGIDPGHIDHLFDPFFTTKEPGKGTGLGLFICARLVEGMGGGIEAANRPGGGALFTLRFPALGAGTAPTPGGGSGPGRRSAHEAGPAAAGDDVAADDTAAGALRAEASRGSLGTAGPEETRAAPATDHEGGTHT